MYIHIIYIYIYICRQHARRLYPFLISSKDTVEYAYCQQQQEEEEDAHNQWKIVDHKSIIANYSNHTNDENDIIILPDDVLRGRAIGFEGKPDPATGYYCLYNEGRVVKSTGMDKDKKISSSKKLG
jgi:hypothetical protein